MDRVIIVFGGAFNPPTHSHFSLAEQLCSEYSEIEKVIFVPVSDRYPKEDLLEATHRVEMLKRVCDKNPNFEVSTIEVDSEELLCTIQTLRRIQKEYPEHEIWFTMGTDNLKGIEGWFGYKELITEFRALVLERGEDIMEHIIDQKPELKQHKERFIKAKETVKSNCNSTLIRNKLRRGKSIRYLVPDEVYEYIRIRDLYKVEEWESPLANNPQKV